MENRSFYEIVRRYIVVLLAQFVIALGITFTVLSNTGTTPLSTIPNVIFLRYPIISFGTYSFLWSVLLILIQVVIKRKRFKLAELLQVPLTLVFSPCLDLTNWMFSWVDASSLVVKIILLLLGLFIISLGIAMEVSADVVIGCGEAIVNVFSELIHKSFSFGKNFLDITYVVVGIILSFIFFGKLDGIGVGTIFLGLTTGTCVHYVHKMIEKPLKHFYAWGNNENNVT